MNSFERIANLLDTTEAVEDTSMETSTLAGAEAPAKTAMEEKLLSAKGENKIPSKTFKKQKHQIASKSKKNKEKKERPKPRYFCEFK